MANTTDVVHYIMDKEHLTQAHFKDVKQRLSDNLEAIFDVLYIHGSLTLRGYGRFYLVTKPYQIKRNPQTGQPSEVLPRIDLRFEPSRKLVNSINTTVVNPQTNELLKHSMLRHLMKDVPKLRKEYESELKGYQDRKR